MLIEETIKCEDTINVETNVNESQNMNNDDAGDHKQEQTQSEMIENVQSSISLNGEVTHEVDCNEQIAIEGSDKPESIHNGDEDEFDDFCDFESYQNENNKTSDKLDTINQNNGKVDEDMNFANFNNSDVDIPWTSDNADLCDDADEDFADFESADVVSDTSAISTNVNSETDWALLFKKTFDSAPNFNKNCDETFSMELFDDKSQCLWNNLQNMDLKIICAQRWKGTDSFRWLLQALKLDINLIRPDLNLLYSQNYGQILEPTIASPNNVNQQPIGTIATTTDVTSKFEDQQKPIDQQQNSSCQPTTILANIDQELDFFESKYNSNSTNNNNIKDDLLSELENIILDDNSTTVNDSQDSSIVDLKKMMVDGGNNNEQVLSAEALQILNELPNLSFMRAKVLMFPINDI